MSSRHTSSKDSVEKEVTRPSSLKLYGHPISQPTRAVLWALAIKKIPYEFVRVEPLRGDTTKDDFLLRFPQGQVPAIVDGNVRLTEAHAILAYLADKHGWEDWYPKDLSKRAVINQWLHWHHGNVRLASGYFFAPVMLSGSLKTLTAKGAVLRITKGATLFNDTLKVMKYGAFVDGATNRKKFDFLAGDHPTLADLSAYCEFDQLEAFGLLDVAGVSKFPEVLAWMERMKQLPEHDDVRRALVKLGRRMEPVSRALVSDVQRSKL